MNLQGTPADVPSAEFMRNLRENARSVKEKKKGVINVKVNEELTASEFVKIDDVPKAITVKIVGKAEQVTTEFGDRINISVKLRGGEKVLTLNKTSLKRVCTAYTDETDKWTGKSLRLKPITMFIQGKEKLVVMAEPI